MIKRFALAVSFCSSLFFGWLYYQFYWKWRDVFNEDGRYFDETTMTVYQEQSGMVWGLLFFASFIVAMISLVFYLKDRASSPK